jgi:TonB family protein
MPKQRTTLAILILTLGLLTALPAHGQDNTSPTTATAPALLPPRLITFVDAKLPDGISPKQVIEVELDLVVAADGKVTQASAVDGKGDVFETAAIEAAKQFVFTPAERAGKPIAARLHYRYVFTPPAPTTGALEGRVLARELDQPLDGATVSIAEADRTLSVKPDGTFAFPDLPPGDYHVTFTAPGMQPLASVESVVAGEAATLTVRLDPIPVETKKDEQPILEFGATASVEAPPREVTKRTLTAEELVGVAGTRGDALRVIELMPGVARPPGAMGVVIIRGAAPADSAVKLEGVGVPHLYHFGGLTSFVQGRLLDRIDLYPGNFSARYGRKMGGVVDVTLRDPKTDRLRGMVDVNVIDASAMAEGPVSEHVSAVFAVRRSYIDAFFGALANSTDLQITAAPVYYDYQGMVTWKPTAADRLRLFVFGSTDSMRLVLKKSMENDPAFRGNVAAETALHRLQGQWRHAFSDSFEQEVTLAAGPIDSYQSIGNNLNLDVDTWEYHLRAEWRLKLGRYFGLILGTDSNSTKGNIHYRGPRLPSFEGDPSAFSQFSLRENVALNLEAWVHRPAAFAELAFTPTPALRIVAGLRTDYYSELEKGSVDPRLSARYELRPGTTLKGGVGLFSQPPDIAQSLRIIGNPDLGVSHAQHYSVGVEQKLGFVQTSVEGFYKRLDNLVVGSNRPDVSLESGGEGRIYGGEFSLRTQVGARGYGFVSYTLSKSERNDHGEYWRRFDWDQPHILTASGTYRVGGGVEVGSTFRYVSGNPYTPVVAAKYDGNVDVYRAIYGRVNTARNDPFVQLDVRIEKLWTRNWGKVALYLDVQNVTNRQNPEGRYYNFDYSQSRTVPGLPIIPSLGLRGEL